MASWSKVTPFKLEQQDFVICRRTQLHKSDRDGDTIQSMGPRKISKTWIPNNKHDKGGP